MATKEESKSEPKGVLEGHDPDAEPLKAEDVIEPSGTVYETSPAEIAEERRKAYEDSEQERLKAQEDAQAKANEASGPQNTRARTVGETLESASPRTSSSKGEQVTSEQTKTLASGKSDS